MAIESHRLFYFDKTIKRFADHPALIDTQRTLSYRQFSQSILHSSRKLRRFGLGQGDRLAIVAPNSMQYVILLVAAWRSGVVAIPVNTRLPAARIRENLNQVGCSAIVLDKSLRETNQFPDLATHYLDDIVSLQSENLSQDDEHQTVLSLDQDATVIFTSGSSGSAKAVLHTFGNHYFNALGSNMNIPVHPGDRWLLSLPLYHVGGLAILFRALLGGGGVVIPDSRVPLEKSIVELKATHISLVATQLYRLMQAGTAIDYLRKMKVILLGGSAIPSVLVKEAAGLGLPIFTSYGSTEMASQVTTTAPDDGPERLVTSGKLLPFRKMKIAPDGEILVRGRTLFRGYVTGNSVTQPDCEKGWFSTGDLGHFDDQDYLVVHGRKDNMFVSGGENIQPEEIERILGEMDGVADVVVVPVESEEFGQRPAAFIKMRGGEEREDRKFEEFLTGKLPRFKLPDYFFPWPEEGDKPGMKIDRAEFRRLAAERLR